MGEDLSETVNSQTPERQSFDFSGQRCREHTDQGSTNRMMPQETATNPEQTTSLLRKKSLLYEVIQLQEDSKPLQGTESAKKKALKEAKIAVGRSICQESRQGLAQQLRRADEASGDGEPKKLRQRDIIDNFMRSSTKTEDLIQQMLDMLTRSMPSRIAS